MALDGRTHDEFCHGLPVLSLCNFRSRLLRTFLFLSLFFSAFPIRESPPPPAWETSVRASGKPSVAVVVCSAKRYHGSGLYGFTNVACRSNLAPTVARSEFGMPIQMNRDAAINVRSRPSIHACSEPQMILGTGIALFVSRAGPSRTSLNNHRACVTGGPPANAWSMCADHSPFEK